MSKRNISFTKPPEPSFIKKMKESMGYQEPDTIETKMKMADYDSDDDVDRADEKPVIVVLKPGDISEEDLKKVEEQADEDQKIVFAKPAKKTAEEKNSLDFSSKKKKDLQKRIDSEKEKTKKIHGNKFHKLLGIVRLKNNHAHTLSVISPTTRKKSPKPTTSKKMSGLEYGIWNMQMESQFIKLIKKQRHLWDSNHALYPKKSAKRQTYQVLGNYMSKIWPGHEHLFTADALMTKFSHLRTYYQREVRKWKVINSQAGSNTFKPRWFHFSAMSFMNNELSTTENSSDLDLSEISNPDIDELQSIVEMPTIRIEKIKSLQPCNTEQEDWMEDALQTKDGMDYISQAKDEMTDFSSTKTVNISQLNNVADFTQSKDMIEDFSYLTGITAGFSQSANETENCPQSNGEVEDVPQYEQACSGGSVNHRLKEIKVHDRKNKSVNADFTQKVSAPTTAISQHSILDKDANEAFGQYVGLTLGSITDDYKKEIAKIEIIKVLIKYKFNK